MKGVMKSDKKTQTIINTLTDFLGKGGDLSKLKQVVSQFEEVVKKESRDNTALVYSAHSLDQAQKKELEKILVKNFNHNLEFEYQLDPNLIAGLKIQVKDFVLDMSLSSELYQISQSLNN